MDDFNWFLPADERTGDLPAPESEIEVSDSESEVEYIEPDLIPLQTEMTARQLLCPLVVAQTRPMEGCDPALPRRLRRGRDVLTEDGAVAVDTKRASAASDAVVSRETRKFSEGVTDSCVQVGCGASEVTQPRPPESGCTDLLPPVDDCRESLGLGTPDAVESGMEVAGGIPPAEIDISVNPDMLLTATSVTTEVLESVDVSQDRHCRTTVVRIMPDICYPRLIWCIEEYVVRSSIIVVPIIWYGFRVFRVRAMASDRLPDREEAGPSCTPSGPFGRRVCMSWRRTFQM